MLIMGLCIFKSGQAVTFELQKASHGTGRLSHPGRAAANAEFGSFVEARNPSRGQSGEMQAVLVVSIQAVMRSKKNSARIVISHGAWFLRWATTHASFFVPLDPSFAWSPSAWAQASVRFRFCTRFTSMCSQGRAGHTTSGESGEPENCCPRRAS